MILTKDDIQSYWENNKRERYKKFGTVLMKLPNIGEKIDTIIESKKETTNIAKAGDVLIKGAKGELYLIDSKKAESRYRFAKSKLSTEDWITAEAVGLCWATKYIGKPATFIAPWGEKMAIVSGDYLASPVEQYNDDIYRIEREAFLKTYRRG